ncbi:MAG: hypothetical protein OHK0017_04810 [Patescibacteria group bacterium]
MSNPNNSIPADLNRNSTLLIKVSVVVILLGILLGGVAFYVESKFNFLAAHNSTQSANYVPNQVEDIVSSQNISVAAQQQFPDNTPEEPTPAFTSVSQTENANEQTAQPLLPPQDPCLNQPVITMECKKEYIDALEESKTAKIIVVDVTSQRMQALELGKVSLDTLVTTGRDGYETPSGVYTIQNKARKVNLKANAYFRARGENYNVWSDYWLGLGDGYGIHDAWRWRSVYGGQDYHTKGSHGCVNTPLEAMKTIYSWADVGTKVVIFR